MDTQTLPPTMTFDVAVRFIALHYIETRRCDDAACIEALAVGTARDGTPFAEWERLPLRFAPIRAWLGY